MNKLRQTQINLVCDRYEKLLQETQSTEDSPSLVDFISACQQDLKDWPEEQCQELTVELLVLELHYRPQIDQLQGDALESTSEKPRPNRGGRRNPVEDQAKSILKRYAEFDIDAPLRRALEIYLSDSAASSEPIIDHIVKTGSGSSIDTSEILPAAISILTEHLEDEIDQFDTLLPIEERKPGHFDPSSKRMLGRFELLEELGNGGYGPIFRAIDMINHREVALRIPRLSGTIGPGAIGQLQSTSFSLSRLDHVHLGKTVPSETVAGYFCLVSEYLEGLPLPQWCHEAPLSEHDAIELAIQICAGLERAHTERTLHGGLTAACVLVVSAQDFFEAKLVDFGLAIALRDPAGSAYDSFPRHVTPYLAPEQLTSGEASRQSDIYSVGVILFELLTGRLPFDPDQSMTVVADIQYELPDLVHRLKPGVSRSLSLIIDRCLRKEPDARYPSMLELREDLCRLRAGQPIVAQPRSWGMSLWYWLRNPIAKQNIASFCLLSNLAILIWLLIWLLSGIGTSAMAREPVVQNKMVSDGPTIITLGIGILIHLPMLWVGVRLLRTSDPSKRQPGSGPVLLAGVLLSALSIGWHGLILMAGTRLMTASSEATSDGQHSAGFDSGVALLMAITGIQLLAFFTLSILEKPRDQRALQQKTERLSS